MEIGTGERGPRTEMLEFEVTSKPEFKVRTLTTEGDNGKRTWVKDQLHVL